MKFRKSLLVKYLGVLVLFLVIAPFLNVLLVVNYNIFNTMTSEGVKYQPKYTYKEVEHDWHQSAEAMADVSDKKKIEKLKQLKEKYPESTLFWVDKQGTTRLKMPEAADVPDQWTAPMVVKFMKKSVNADPFTVVALLGETHNDGFMTIQMPRSVFNVPVEASFSNMITSVLSFFMLLVLNIGLFIFLSWLFFSRIRKRLTTLQRAMKEAEETGDFMTVPVRKDDEITDLERSFNQMAQQLRESRERELGEEQLRRELIANLSHDLRTPLTVIRGHAYSLEQDRLSEKGKQSLAVIDDKIRYLGDLIDNLLSFSLLTAGRYPYHPERVNVIRLLRSFTASWYPVLEKEGFEVDVQLPEHDIYWEVDTQWFQRIWDNLFQNVLRYAAEGQYVRIALQTGKARTCFVLEDRGPGIGNKPGSKGAGIGLSIVSLMAKEMDLTWHVESADTGTVCYLCKESPYE